MALSEELNKDFLLRIKNNKFEIANQRVSVLCDFLEIELEPQIPSQEHFQKEFERVASLIASKPHLKAQVRILLEGIVELAESTNKVS